MRDPVEHIRAVVIALAVAITPHIPDMPLWIIAWCVFFWGYLLYIQKKRKSPPGRFIRRLLTAVALAAVLVGIGLGVKGQFFVALLLVMAGLKPLEIRNHRDRMVTIFLAYFLVITSLFQSESLPITFYMFISILVTTAALIRINHPGSNLRDNLRLSARIMVQALPLMAILFFLFPRIHGSIWAFSTSPSGKTGFSDVITPGDLSLLVKNNKTAFRAEFKGDIPPPRHRYWRGIVFWKFDGKSWHKGDFHIPWLKKLPVGQGTVAYSLLLEPQNSKWIFALDLPLERPSRTRLLDDYTLVSRQVITKQTRFELKSRTAYTTGPLERWAQLPAYQLPEQGNPRARVLAQTWARQAAGPGEIIDRAIGFFRNNDFVYTLKPPLLNEDPIDTFLFKTRKGYCEHYASAFAFLLRAAGVPCRLVGGYLGGELNPYGNYLVVRQSDAHVWAEVWLENRGWVRVDPTAAVAPRRIAGGIEGSVPADELPGFLLFDKYGPLGKTWREIRFGWDAANIMWDLWFSDYSFQQQKELLEKLGIRVGSWQGMAKMLLSMAGGVMFIAALIAVWSVRKPPGKKDPVLATYTHFCARLAKIGIPRKPEQGPADFAKTVCAARKDLKPEVETITDLYILLRYNRGGGQEALKQFKTIVRRFTPDAGKIPS